MFLAVCLLLQRPTMSKEARRAAKGRSQNLSRRRETLFNKAYELGENFGIDVAVILKRNGQYYTYRSIDRLAWPPSMAEIVGNIHFIRAELILGQETTYPLPKNFLPVDLEKRTAKRKSSTQSSRAHPHQPHTPFQVTMSGSPNQPPDDSDYWLNSDLLDVCYDPMHDATGLERYYNIYIYLYITAC